MLNKGRKPPKYLLLSNFYGLTGRKHICHKKNNEGSIKYKHVGSTRSKWIKKLRVFSFLYLITLMKDRILVLIRR